jgi:hypothetical protein
MQFLRKKLDEQHHLFEKGGKLERFYYRLRPTTRSCSPQDS